MATFFLILSAILFISSFGIHMMISNGEEIEKPMYTHDPKLSIIPWVSGFILPVIPFTIVFEYHFLAIFVINIGVVYIFGPIFSRNFLVRFASSKGLGHDLLNSFIGGIGTLIIGILVR